MCGRQPLFLSSDAVSVMDVGGFGEFDEFRKFEVTT